MGDWVEVGEALGCHVLRLRAARPQWLTWSACASGNSCQEADLGAATGEHVYYVLGSRRGTPRILVRSDHHLWVVDASGTLVDGLAFAPCVATAMDARGDRILSMFQQAGGVEQGLALLDVGTEGASVSPFPVGWNPGAQPVLGNDRFLYPEPPDPPRLLSVALADPSDVIQLTTTSWFLPVDADDSFLYFDVSTDYQSLYRTDGIQTGMPFLALANESVCWAQRSYDSLVWSLCKYTPGASDRVHRTSFAAPSEASSTLLLEQPHAGFGIAAEGRFVSNAGFSVRVDDGQVASLESAPGDLVGVTATHAYRFSSTWAPGGGDYRYRLYRVSLP